MYFPDLGDKNAEKNAPKKKEANSGKNAGLFGESSNTTTSTGNWGMPKSDKFREQNDAIRFTNAKGNTE